MASSNTRSIIVQPGITESPRYFLITITNYPNLLQRTQQYQQPPNQYWQQQYQTEMLIPGALVHFGTAHSYEHEILLYNTSRFELQETIRAYLQRTRRPYPIYLIFNMSDMGPQL